MKDKHLASSLNSEGETINAHGFVAYSLGTESDAVFRIGRNYASKGYTPAMVEKLIRNKPEVWRENFMHGWRWQKQRG